MAVASGGRFLVVTASDSLAFTSWAGWHFGFIRRAVRQRPDMNSSRSFSPLSTQSVRDCGTPDRASSEALRPKSKSI
ncbi:hypothetical protein K461DRAFT_147384 [Myriangium duriaei CBS 260.36]|uniref:Uncharacterized protein n=1 Tax=Myriangium duriaei CBS 260.36 TaxID=1168546 RepID=A0A9P4IYZ3_9PEZI|nr:hypothetical protein K461DRAFT_147384 [Myriangium duriaei CBS 260.36]